MYSLGTEPRLEAEIGHPAKRIVQPVRPERIRMLLLFVAMVLVLVGALLVLMIRAPS